MKNSLCNFKKKILLFAAASSLALLPLTNVHAQTLVQPTTSDRNWYTAPTTAAGSYATAMIAYGTSNTIYAIVDRDGNIHVNDDAVGSTSLTTFYPVGSTTGLDVIIGNWDGVSTGCSTCVSPNTDYLMAIARRDNSFSGNVLIDYYDIYDDGISTISVTPLPLHTSMYPGSPSNIHMDLIAEAGNTCVTGRPFCNKFAITWSNSSNIFACTTNLNNPASTLSVVSVVPPPQPGQSYFMPDVAYIQRGGFAWPRMVHDIALIPYVSSIGGNQELDMAEWDVTTGLVNNSTLDMSPSSFYETPRIDALDDYNLNSNPANANYKVVALVNPPSLIQEVRTYDNTMPTSVSFAPSNLVNVSSVPGFGAYGPPYTGGVEGPCVALNGNFDYQVAYALRYDALAPVPRPAIMIMAPINWTASMSLSGGNYYWVNSNGTPTNSFVGDVAPFSTSVATPVNDLGLGNLVVWQVDNPTTVDYDYKIANSSYNFRHAATVNTVQQVSQWNIYPNPVTSELVFNSAADVNADYQVIDVLGRTLLQGKCTGRRSVIDVDRLAAGTYIFKLHTATDGDTQKKFIKN